MLSEILPHLDIPSDGSEQNSNSKSNLIVVPDIRNKTITEAKKILTGLGFTCNVSSAGDENSTLVANQTPKPGISLSKNSIIMLYGEDNTMETSVAVPDLKGMSLSAATNALRAVNLNISAEGNGVVTTQEYSRDELVPEGTVIHVNLKQNLTDAH